MIQKTAIPREVSKVDVSGWSAYENSDLGLSFDYPKDWIVHEMGGEIVLQPARHPDSHRIKFVFDFDDYRGKKTADHWKREERKRIFLLNERKFVRTDDTESKLGTVALLDEERNHQIFIVAQNDDEKLSDECVRTYNGILKTMKWDNSRELKKQSHVDEIQSTQDLIDGEYDFGDIDTGDWKEYRDEHSGFLVKIPQNWYGEQWSKGHCLREVGKDYLIDGREVCAVYVGTKYRYNPMQELSFRGRILGLKKEGHQMLSVNIGGSSGVIASKGFVSVYFFKDDRAWSISSSLDENDYPVVFETYPGILKTFKFVD